MRTMLLLATALIALVPLGQAGTSDKPEVDDAAGDGGIDALDIQTVWIDTTDTANLTFHLTLKGDVPAIEQDTSYCDGADCAFASLSWRIIFRAMGPDGKPAPTVADYNRSYVVFRNGPQDESLTSSIGYFDSKDAITLNGSAAITVSGKEIVLRLPRDNPAINMPKGAMPGAFTIDRLYAYDSPQGCVPPQDVPEYGIVQCAPLLKPFIDPATPDGGAVSNWDRAPDEGYGNTTTFEAPPAQPATNPTTTSQSQTQSPTTQPSATPTTSSSSSSTTTTTHATTTTASTAPLAKSTPGLPLLAAIAALALVGVRRRLP